MGTETAKRPPAFRDALLRLRRPGSAGAPPPAGSKPPPPLVDSPVMPSMAASARPADADAEVQPAASRRAAGLGAARAATGELSAAAAGTPAERPAPIVPAAAGRPDAGSAPAAPEDPVAPKPAPDLTMASTKALATAWSSDTADRHGEKPMSCAPSAFPVAHAHSGNRPAATGLGVAATAHARVAVQDNAPANAADPATAAQVSGEAQAALAAKANPGLLLSAGRRMAGAMEQGEWPFLGISQ